MDTLSHALWGYAVTLRKAKFGLAAFFGAFPDLFAFTLPFTIGILNGGLKSHGPPNFPDYIGFLYSLSHSLVICALVFAIIYAFKKKIYLWMIGWPLHILMDIPTHEKAFFATPFLYPLSNFTVDGIRWSNPYIFSINWILLFGVYAYLFRKEIKNVFTKKKK